LVELRCLSEGIAVGALGNRCPYRDRDSTWQEINWLIETGSRFKIAAGMELPMEILKWVLAEVQGLDAWVVIICAVFALGGWKWLDAKKIERKKLLKKWICVIACVALAVIVIKIHNLIPPKPFQPDVAGILVLRIVGDDHAESRTPDIESTRTV
jgi:hypothetical protein